MVQRTEIQEKNLQRVERDGPCDMFFFFTQPGKS